MCKNTCVYTYTYVFYILLVCRNNAAAKEHPHAGIISIYLVPIYIYLYTGLSQKIRIF